MMREVLGACLCTSDFELSSLEVFSWSSFPVGWRSWPKARRAPWGSSMGNNENIQRKCRCSVDFVHFFFGLEMVAYP